MKKIFISFLCISMIIIVASCDKKQPVEYGFTMTDGNPKEYDNPYLFHDGYVYSPRTWNFIKDNNTDLKGEKIGDASLDLSLKDYTGTPPDFSSIAMTSGTPIYEYKNHKRDYAVVAAVSEDINDILYCNGFANRDSYDGVKVSDVIRKISSYPRFLGIFPKTPKIIAVEFFNKGILAKKMTDKNFISQINKELPDLEIKDEPGEPIISNGESIFMTLLLDNDLEMTFETISNNGVIFGGFIKIPDALMKSIENANEEVKIVKIID